MDKLKLRYYLLPKHLSKEYQIADAPRFCTILNGRKEVSVNQSASVEYDQDQFILLPSHSRVSMHMPETTQALVYEFSDQLISQVSQRVSDTLEINSCSDMNYSNFFVDHISHRVAALHQRAQEILCGEDSNTSFLIELTCLEMVYELMKMKGCNDIIYSSENHPINQAMRLMNASEGSCMSVSEVAEMVGMTLSGFSQKFKLVTDTTPREYMTRVRLAKAKQLLDTMSVTDTAFEVGYDSLSYFIQLFKREYGFTPKQYQRSNLNQRAVMPRSKH